MGDYTRRARRLVRIGVPALLVGALLPAAAFVGTAHAAIKTWDGGGGDQNWSTGANWTDDITPSPGDALVFPVGPAQKQTNNDFAAGTAFASVTIEDVGYGMGGNGVELTALNVTANGGLGIGWGNGGPGIIVPAGGTFTETIGVNAEVTQSMQVDVGNGTLVYNVNGLLTTPHLYVDVQPGGNVVRTGTGTLKMNQGSMPEIPWSISSGATYFNANNTFGANVTQTGGVFGGQTANIRGLTATDGNFSPGNDVTDVSIFFTVDGNLSLTGVAQYEVDFIDDSNHDRVFVNGTVALGGPLIIDATGFIPSPNQTYTIINKMSAGAVSGTFALLPEGAVIPVNGVDMTISYVGGDGNDVTLTTPSSFVWDGEAAPDTNWMTAANWVGDVAPPPNADADLTFPNVAALAATNNFPIGTSFGDIFFTGAGYMLSGNRIALTGSIIGNHGGGTNTLGLPIEMTGGGTVNASTAGAGLSFTTDLAADGGVITFSGNGYVTSSGSLINDAEFVQTTGSALLTAGTGALVITGNSPNFAGPITNNGRFLQIDGTLSQAQAVLQAGQVASAGSVDGLSADGGTVYPGAQMAPGVMTSTSDVTLGAGSTFEVDANTAVPGTGYDQLNVTGTVTLGGTLQVVSAGGPPIGADLVIISNDGIDPVNGTFSGLPEGSVVTVNGIPMVVSYVGGDGNDVTLSTTASVWDGGGADDNWMTAANWVGDVAPVPGPNQTIVFPEVAARKANNNDFAGPTPFKDIIFTGSGYNLTGARPDLFGGVIATNTSGTNTLTFQVDLNGSSTFTQASGGELITGSTILFGPNTLTLAGDGTFRLNGQISGSNVDKTGNGLATFATSPTFSGTLTVTQGSAQLGGNIPAAVVVNGGALTGAGAVGSGITTNGNGGVAPGSVTHGVLTTSIFAASSPTASTGFDVNGNTPGVTQDQLVVNGPVTLNGFLGISTMAVPPIAQEIVLISKTTAGPVSGTFAGVPEGGSVLIGGGPWSATISYAGGDGNDVTMFVPPTFTWDGGGADSQWSTPANWQTDDAPTGAGGETLVFPNGANQLVNQNDIFNATFEEILFTGSGYVVAGVGVALTQGVTATNVSGSNTFAVPTSAQADLTIAQAAGGTLSAGATMDLNGGVLHIVGAGSHTNFDQVIDGDIDVSAVGSGSVTLTGTMPGLGGSVVLNSGLLVLDGDLVPDVQVAGGRLEGDGGAAGIVATAGVVAPGGAATAVLDSTATLDLDAASTFEVDLATPTPGTGHDQIATTGNVSLGASLAVTPTGAVAPGDQFTIVDNGSANAVSGTFAGLADGASFLAGGVPFTIDYQGGTGNDVVLTAGPHVSLSTAAVAVAEGDSGASTSAGLSVELDQAIAGDVVVHVAITGGSASAGTDTSVLDTNLTIPGGATSVAVPLNVLGDDTVEPDETIDVTLTIVSGAALLPPTVATVTITNDDAATITVPNPNVVVTEGGPGSQGLALAAVSQLVLALDNPSSTDIGVHIATADGTAVAPADYAGFDQVFTIPAGSTSFIVPLSIVDDNIDEPDETFTIRFLGATGATLAASDVTVTLVDNDVPTVTPPSSGPSTTVDPGTLPATGGSPNRTLWLAGALLVFGAVLIAVRRRRAIAS